jgi:hypothetical protein
MVNLLLFLVALAAGARSGDVSIRATTAAVIVTGGAASVSARLVDADGRELPGLAIERDGSRTSIVLVAAVRPGARIEARVPADTGLRVDASNGGAVTVRGVRGQIEIVNSNAAIRLEAVGGTVLASTSNGAITATLVSVDESLPMSFQTSNEPIDVALPAAVKATVCMETDTGPITTEFPLAATDGPVERKIMRGGRLRTVMCGAINGGGARIELRTENAPIRVRKAA